MKPRIDRSSTTRPKKPLRSPGTNQRGLACRVLLVMESFLRGCAARPHPPPAFAGAGSSGTFSRYAGEGLDDKPSTINPPPAQRKRSWDSPSPAKRERGWGEGTLRTRSEEHTSELQSLMRISYAVFCLTKK